MLKRMISFILVLSMVMNLVGFPISVKAAPPFIAVSYSEAGGNYTVNFTVTSIPAGVSNVTVGVERRAASHPGFEMRVVRDFEVNNGTATGVLYAGRLVEAGRYYIVVNGTGMNSVERLIFSNDHNLGLSVSAETTTVSPGGSIPVTFTIDRDNYIGELRITSSPPWFSEVIVPSGALSASGTINVPAAASLGSQNLTFTVSRVAPQNQYTVNSATSNLNVTVQSASAMTIDVARYMRASGNHAVNFSVSGIPSNVSTVSIGVERREPSHELRIVGEFPVVGGVVSGNLFAGVINSAGQYHLVAVAGGQSVARLIDDAVDEFNLGLSVSINSNIVLPGVGHPVTFNVTRGGYMGALRITSNSDWIGDTDIAANAMSVNPGMIYAPADAAGLTDIVFTISAVPPLPPDTVVNSATATLSFNVQGYPLVTSITPVESANVINIPFEATNRTIEYDVIGTNFLFGDGLSAEHFSVDYERITEFTWGAFSLSNVTDTTARLALTISVPAAPPGSTGFEETLLVYAPGTDAQASLTITRLATDEMEISELTYSAANGTVNFTVTGIPAGVGTITVGIERRTPSSEMPMVVRQFAVSGGTVSGVFNPGVLDSNNQYFLVAVGGTQTAQRQIPVDDTGSEHVLGLTISPNADTVTVGVSKNIPVTFTIERDGYMGALRISTPSTWLDDFTVDAGTTASRTVIVPALSVAGITNVEFTVARVATTPINIFVTPATANLQITASTDTTATISGIEAANVVVEIPAEGNLDSGEPAVFNVTGTNFIAGELRAEDFSVALHPGWVVVGNLSLVVHSETSATLTVIVSADENTAAGREGHLSIANTVSPGVNGVTLINQAAKGVVTPLVINPLVYSGANGTVSFTVTGIPAGVDTITIGVERRTPSPETVVVRRFEVSGGVASGILYTGVLNDDDDYYLVAVADGATAQRLIAVDPNTYHTLGLSLSATPTPTEVSAGDYISVDFTIERGGYNGALRISTPSTWIGNVLVDANETEASGTLRVPVTTADGIYDLEFTVARVATTPLNIFVTPATANLQITVGTIAPPYGVTSISPPTGSGIIILPVDEKIISEEPHAIFEIEGTNLIAHFENDIEHFYAAPGLPDWITVGAYRLSDITDTSATLTVPFSVTANYGGDMRNVSLRINNTGSSVFGTTAIIQLGSTETPVITSKTPTTSTLTIPSVGKNFAAAPNATINVAGDYLSLTAENFFVEDAPDWLEWELQLADVSDKGATVSVLVQAAPNTAETFRTATILLRNNVTPAVISVLVINQPGQNDATVTIGEIIPVGTVDVPITGTQHNEPPFAEFIVTGTNFLEGGLSAEHFGILSLPEWVGANNPVLSNVTATSARITVPIAVGSENGPARSGNLVIDNILNELTGTILISQGERATTSIEISFVEYVVERGEVNFTVINIPDGVTTITIGVERREPSFEMRITRQFDVINGRATGTLNTGLLDDDEIFYLVAITETEKAERQISTEPPVLHELGLTISPNTDEVMSGVSKNIPVTFTVDRGGYNGALLITTPSGWIGDVYVAAGETTETGIINVPATVTENTTLEFTVARIAQTPINIFVTSARENFEIIVTENNSTTITSIAPRGVVNVSSAGTTFTEEPHAIFDVRGTNFTAETLTVSVFEIVGGLPSWLTLDEMQLTIISPTSATLTVPIAVPQNPGQARIASLTVANTINPVTGAATIFQMSESTLPEIPEIYAIYAPLVHVPLNGTIFEDTEHNAVFEIFGVNFTTQPMTADNFVIDGHPEWVSVGEKFLVVNGANHATLTVQIAVGSEIGAARNGLLRISNTITPFTNGAATIRQDAREIIRATITKISATENEIEIPQTGTTNTPVVFEIEGTNFISAGLTAENFTAQLPLWITSSDATLTVNSEESATFTLFIAVGANTETARFGSIRLSNTINSMTETVGVFQNSASTDPQIAAINPVIDPINLSEDGLFEGEEPSAVFEIRGANLTNVNANNFSVLPNLPAWITTGAPSFVATSDTRGILTIPFTTDGEPGIARNGNIRVGNDITDGIYGVVEVTQPFRTDARPTITSVSVAPLEIEAAGKLLNAPPHLVFDIRGTNLDKLGASNFNISPASVTWLTGISLLPENYEYHSSTHATLTVLVGVAENTNDNPRFTSLTLTNTINDLIATADIFQYGRIQTTDTRLLEILAPRVNIPAAGTTFAEPPHVVFTIFGINFIDGDNPLTADNFNVLGYHLDDGLQLQSTTFEFEVVSNMIATITMRIAANGAVGPERNGNILLSGMVGETVRSCEVLIRQPERLSPSVPTITRIDPAIDPIIVLARGEQRNIDFSISGTNLSAITAAEFGVAAGLPAWITAGTPIISNRTAAGATLTVPVTASENPEGNDRYATLSITNTITPGVTRGVTIRQLQNVAAVTSMTAIPTTITVPAAGNVDAPQIAVVEVRGQLLQIQGMTFNRSVSPLSPWLATDVNIRPVSSEGGEVDVIFTVQPNTTNAERRTTVTVWNNLNAEHYATIEIIQLPPVIVTSIIPTPQSETVNVESGGTEFASPPNAVFTISGANFITSGLTTDAFTITPLSWVETGTLTLSNVTETSATLTVQIRVRGTVVTPFDYGPERSAMLTVRNNTLEGRAEIFQPERIDPDALRINTISPVLMTINVPNIGATPSAVFNVTGANFTDRLNATHFAAENAPTNSFVTLGEIIVNVTSNTTATVTVPMTVPANPIPVPTPSRAEIITITNNINAATGSVTVLQECPDCGDPCTCERCPHCGDSECDCCPDCGKAPCVCGKCPDCGGDLCDGCDECTNCNDCLCGKCPDCGGDLCDGCDECTNCNDCLCGKCPDCGGDLCDDCDECTGDCGDCDCDGCPDCPDCGCCPDCGDVCTCGRKVFLTQLQAALVAAVANPAAANSQNALATAEINGLRRFNVEGLNWADMPAELAAVPTVQRTVVERMLANAARVGESGKWEEGLSSLQIALAASVANPRPATGVWPRALVTAEINGLRRFNVEGLNWADMPTELAAVPTVQRTVVQRMLDAVPPQHQH